MATGIGRVRDFPLLGPKLIEGCTVVSYTGRVLRQGNGRNGVIIVNDRDESLAYVDRPQHGDSADFRLMIAKDRTVSGGSQ
jgi:hypothetical protein